MRRYDLLDEFSTVIAPALAPQTRRAGQSPRPSRRSLAGMAALLGGWLLLAMV